MKTLKVILLAVVVFAAATFKVNAQSEGKTTLNQVLTHYFEVKNALVSGSATDANAKAGALLAAIGEVKPASLADDQQKAWTAYADKLSFDARHISENKDIAHQREHFASLSKNMYDLFKALKVNDVAVYQQYCPMKKASWLSESSAVKNPYYGSAMLTCGKTTETLSPIK
ncbi:DUF3347 domain-containing protein [Mucilaginibacter sp. RS28]|uniref:DUF3347 domain-containing protein n=1 Tax=Mucilaginibacter straminoryzae TaxID=2932774 RepID=A0A9X2B9U4_9SPHI|nr:DUF3347 domain-containing protein [Mucilaginibacter straminoryzae]MCJ8211049.1 DUF3347 domain-containing protein [Mucilaginibacter straminoryzae]